MLWFSWMQHIILPQHVDDKVSEQVVIIINYRRQYRTNLGTFLMDTSAICRNRGTCHKKIIDRGGNWAKPLASPRPGEWKFGLLAARPIFFMGRMWWARPAFKVASWLVWASGQPALADLISPNLQVRDVSQLCVHHQFITEFRLIAA